MKLRISTRIVSLFSIILLAACTQIIRDSRRADYTTTGADETPQYERSEDYEEYMEEASGVSDGQSTNRDRRNIQDAPVAQDESESKAAVDGHQSEGDTSIEPAEHLRSEESPAVRAPELLARVGDQNRKSLPLRSHDIAIVVAGHRVRVVQDLVFENIHANNLSGELMLELPDGATPCYLGMFQGNGMTADASDATQRALFALEPLPASAILNEQIDLPAAYNAPDNTALNWGELRPARMVAAVQGRQVYESVTRQRIDPALAEWAGANKFSTRIFPIPANSYKRVVVAYDRPLRFDEVVRYYPPIPDNRQAPTRITIHSLGDNWSESIFQIEGQTIAARTTDTGLSWSHTIQSRSATTNSENQQGNQNTRPLWYAKARSADLQILAGSDASLPGKLVHLRYRVPEDRTDNRQRNTGNAVFLLDVSQSTRTNTFQNSLRMLRTILENDDSISEFAVIVFDVRAQDLSTGWTANEAATRNALFQKIEAIKLEGATNVTAALDLLNNTVAYRNAQSFFLLSDGQITWEEDRTAHLQARYAQLLAKPWFCYSYGNQSVNRGLFYMLTRSGGRIIHVADGQSLAAPAGAHRSGGMRMESITVGDTVMDYTIAGDPGQVYAGQTLEMALRLKPDSDNFQMNLQLETGPLVIKGSVQDSPAVLNQLAGRAWAGLYVDRLLEWEDGAADEVALALSQHFALSNRLASFIILETDAEYKLYAIEANRVDLDALHSAAQSRARDSEANIARYETIPAEALELIAALRKSEASRVWQTTPAPGMNNGLGIQGNYNEKELESIASAARRLREQNENGAALRVLSTVVELRPRDDRALRMVGFLLMEWNMYTEAAHIFARSRQNRPFEGQNYLLESMALISAGRPADAAIRLEIALKHDGRMNEYIVPIARKLYADLLFAIQSHNADSIAADLAQKRAQALGLTENTAQGRLLLFWNMDDSDMDLHVREPDGFEVYYEKPESPAGGKLFWDNTAGLGPELYEIAAFPTDSMKVMANYYGAQSVEGRAPATTLLGAFRSNANGIQVRWYSQILEASGEQKKVTIISSWK